MNELIKILLYNSRSIISSVCHESCKMLNRYIIGSIQGLTYRVIRYNTVLEPILCTNEKDYTCELLPVTNLFRIQ